MSSRRLTSALFLAVLFTSPAWAATDVPIGEEHTGKITWYTDKGYGACGTKIDASSQNLAAVSSKWFSSSNRNNDPVCKGVSVRVSYNGKSITVPVVDECPSCDREHVDLSLPAFSALADPDDGVVQGVTWSFVR
ncbi:RlpA-like double-psi beta-barrel domain-containing protein [Pendulispora brunnea]|uniref:RlpA-like double-psi beta-barrel domain-containing protein n=1 Tax=Pendulispora brunnea TaxID=2905690 RepID=A0ABZ2KI71_9BACT